MTTDRSQKSREYYLRNADRIKERVNEYRKRPENAEKVKQWRDSYTAKPESAAKVAEYLSRPDVIARRKLRDSARVGNPDELAKRRDQAEVRYSNNWSKAKAKELATKAKQRGLDFNIDETDIPLPEKCPILGITLQRGKGTVRSFSPSVDRIDNTRGYVKGNVVVISAKANSMKQDATLDQLKTLYEFYRNLIEENPNE